MNSKGNLTQSKSLADKIDFNEYWNVLRDQRYLIVATFICVFASCVFYLYKAPRIYQATVSLQVDKDSDNTLSGIKGVVVSTRSDPDYLQTVAKNLKSRTLVKALIAELKLEEDVRYSRAKDLIKVLSEDLTVAPIRATRLIEVKANHTDPQKAAKIVNTLVSIFMKQNTDDQSSKSQEAFKLLTEEAKSMKVKVDRDEEAVHKFKEGHQVVSFDETENVVLLALKQRQLDLEKAVSDSISKTQLANELGNLVRAGLSAEGAQMAMLQQYGGRLTGIQELKKSLTEKESQLANLTQRYRDEHPTIVRLRDEVRSLRAAFERESQALGDGVRADARIAQSIETAFRKALAEQEQKLLTMNKLKIQHDSLNRELQQSKLLYEKITSRLKEIEVTGSFKEKNLTVVDLADAPLKPIKPSVGLTLLLGILGGLAVAIGLAFFVDYVNDTIKTQEDIEAHLQVPFLGYVPSIKRESVVERDLEAHSNPTSISSEGFRTLRAAISLTQQPENLRTIVVTSTIPSEGKSLVASNYAIVSAQSGLRTLLVDADLRRPSVHKAFGIENTIGLSAYLMDQVTDPTEIINTSKVPNLDVVCCGSIPMIPSELIGSKRMEKFLLDMRERYDRVVFDCPPVAAVSDALVLGTLADGAVFVVKFNKIHRDHARKSIQRIQSAGINIFGTVVNDIDYSNSQYYYSEYYSNQIASPEFGEAKSSSGETESGGANGASRSASYNGSGKSTSVPLASTLATTPRRTGGAEKSSFKMNRNS